MKTIDVKTASYNELVQFAAQNEIKSASRKQEDIVKAITKFLKAKPADLKQPRKGSTTEKIIGMLNEGWNRYEVAKQLEQHYSFIHGVAQRYSHLIKKLVIPQ